MPLFPIAKKFQVTLYSKMSANECDDGMSLTLDTDHAFEG